MQNTSSPSELKYGDEFMFVDEVRSIDIEIGKVITVKTYSSHWGIIVAHSLATGPVVPGVLMIEQAAQSALLLQIRRNPELTGYPRLANIRASWSAAARLDVEIIATVQVKDGLAGTAIFEAVLSDEEQEVAGVRGLVTFLKDKPQR